MDPVVKKTGAALLVRYGNDLMLDLRDDKPGLSAALQWTVFAGALEPGETAEVAMNREIREEFGAQIELERIGATEKNTWFVGSLNGQQVANIKRGEGCGHGFFSFDALVALARVEGKGGLGGAIRRFMVRAPEEIRRFLERGTSPDLAKLTDEPVTA